MHAMHAKKEKKSKVILVFFNRFWRCGGWGFYGESFSF